MKSFPENHGIRFVRRSAEIWTAGALRHRPQLWL